MTSSGGTTGVFTVDSDLVVVSWDDWMAHATGLSASEVRGRYLGEVYPELIDRGMVDRMRRVVEAGRVEVLATAFHGYLIPVSPRNPRSSFDRMRQFVTLAPRLDATTPGIVVSIEDVTERFEEDTDASRDLQSRDESVRLGAVRRIGERADPSVLAGAFGDASWRVRREAADALSRSTDEHAVSTLVAAIRERHRDPATLNASLTALAQSAADVAAPVAELLHDSDHDVRTYAALALGLLGDRRAVAALVGRLDDADDNVRFHALEALGRIGDRSAADAIVAVAERREFSVAFAALDALAAIGEPSVAHRLLPLLDEPLLAEPSVHCLGLLASEEVVAPLMQMLPREQSPAATIAVALERIQDRLEEYYAEGELVGDLARAAATPEAAPRLLATLATTTDEQELHALVTVLGWLRAPGIDAALAPLLSRPAVGAHVADVLGGRGIDAAPEIVAAGRDLSGDSRRLAAVALRRIAWDVTTPLLISWLDDEPGVVVAAAGALGAIGDTRAFHPLLRILAHPMATVRQAAVSALNSIGHPDMAGAVVTRLADPHPEVREAAARITGYFGYARGLDRLIALVSDREPIVRRAVVEALASYEDRTAWVAIATAATGDANPTVRAAAVRACRDSRSREVERVVEDAMDDANLWVRYHAILTLTSQVRASGNTPAGVAARFIERVRLDAAPPVRIAAIEGIAALGITRGIPNLIAALGDSEADIAAAAASALGAFDTDESRQALRGAMKTDNAQVCRAAIDSLGRLGDTASVAEIAAVARTAADDLTRRTAIVALGHIGRPESTNALVELLGIRAARAEASRALAEASGDTLVGLIAGLSGPDAGIRCAIIEILARVRRADTTRAVSLALNDLSPAVRHAAAQALSRRDLGDLEQAIASAAAADANPTVRRAASAAMARE